MKRFQEMGVYSFVDRSEAYQDPSGIFVKETWVLVNMGSGEQQKVRCRWVAQEYAHGDRDDELTLCRDTFGWSHEVGHLEDGGAMKGEPHRHDLGREVRILVRQNRDDGVRAE